MRTVALVILAAALAACQAPMTTAERLDSLHEAYDHFAPGPKEAAER